MRQSLFRPVKAFSLTSKSLAEVIPLLELRVFDIEPNFAIKRWNG
jgi:hypothetical protein